MMIVPTTVEEWRSWLQESVLPYWERTVAGKPGGYVEYLSLDGEPDERREKTPLVTARLIYAFSHAHVLGLSQTAVTAAKQGLSFLTQCCWDFHSGGFFHTVTAAGAPVDRRKDLYDHAFVLFALAWFYRAFHSREPLDWAKRTIDFMDAVLADQANGGYQEYWSDGDPGDLPRRQNPHMHLLEAFHALYEFTGEGVWQKYANRIIDLFAERFFDKETGTLGEFFTKDWQPAPGSRGVVREPGHHFEWVWLLHHNMRLMGQPRVLGAAEQLYRFAVTYGFEREPQYVPAAFDEVDRGGRLIKASKLLWPQTEAIKAFLARWEFSRDRDAAHRARNHLAMLFRWFLVDRTGRWRNQLSRDGKEISPNIPVRVFYHFFLCLAEVLRLWPTLSSHAPD